MSLQLLASSSYSHRNLIRSSWSLSSSGNLGANFNHADGMAAGPAGMVLVADILAFTVEDGKSGWELQRG